MSSTGNARSATALSGDTPAAGNPASDSPRYTSVQPNGANSVFPNSGEMRPWDFDLTQRVCVVVGSEGSGVQRLVKERCDARVRLPMAGKVASLNASAAAAALLYEVMRQRAAS